MSAIKSNSWPSLLVVLRHGAAHRLTLVAIFAIIAVLWVEPMWCQNSGPVTTRNAADWTFSNMHRHPWFLEVLVASLVGWALSMSKGFASVAEWLNRYFPNPPKLIVFLLDVIVFIVVGSYFGTAIYNPNNLLEALAAGISWPVGLGALATKG
jgi:hypothetical protein